MKLGAVCYASATGLGYQTKALYDHLRPARTMLVDLSDHNHTPLHEDWYNADVRTKGFPTDADIDKFLDGLDAVFVCETPLNYQLFTKAREQGIATILQLNAEFLDYFRQPWLPRPTVMAMPSPWMEKAIRKVAGDATVIDLPVPIDLDQLPQRTITKARRFIHIAGRPAAHDRNGTLDFIAAARQASRLVLDGVEFIVYCQQPTAQITEALKGSPVKLVGHVDNPTDLYKDADVLVLPRRYGGLCLPAQEAIGCGIPVLMPDISPNNDWLPPDMLLRVGRTTSSFMARTAITVYSTDVQALANRLIYLAQNDDVVQELRQQAKQLAQERSWSTLLPLYEEVISHHE